MKRMLMIACAFACALPALVAEKPKALELVPALDVNRYLGRWYEIARFDKSFEKGLVGCTAEYALRQDGKISVKNSGFRKTLEGKLQTAKGVARAPDKAKPMALKVSFFWPFEGDYLVFGLDPEYRWALVGDNSRKYLWFLARDPEIPPETLDMMKGIALAQGYDLSSLYVVPQKARSE